MDTNLSQLMFLDQVISQLKLREKGSIVKDALINHRIEESLRAKMVDWMIEVITKFELNTKTFFLSVKIMDKYLQLSKTTLESADILLLGITCMFIAHKLEDVVRYNIKVFEKGIGHNKVTAKDIVEMEQKILIALNFSVDMPVCVDFLTLICGIYGVPECVKKASENLLIIFQLYYNLQYLPSLETGCALVLASKFLGYDLNQEILLFISTSADFFNRVLYMKEQLSLRTEGMKKYKNAFLYRKFELVACNSNVYFKFMNEEENTVIA